MPIPVISLDDRKFDDLVKEARERLQYHLPEMAQIVEGDPIHALVDIFAWMTETVIYRANLIPERQRQAFLNILQLPLRPAIPSRGILSVDAKPVNSASLPSLLPSESTFKSGDITFSSQGELQPMPLAVAVMMKEKMDTAVLNELGISEHSLRELYNTEVRPFRPRTLTPGVDALNLQQSLDHYFYLAVHLPGAEQVPQANLLRQNLVGKIMNIGIAPMDDLPAQRAEEISPRKLQWEIAWKARPEDKRASYLPLETLSDSSNGGRNTGVVRLRLPKSESALNTDFHIDPQYAGFDNTPPEPPTHVAPGQVLFWLRLSAPEEKQLVLGYLGINSVDVIGQSVVRDEMIGIGTGRPGQAYSVQRADVEAASLDVQVSEHGSFVSWTQVEHLANSGPEDRVYRFDAASSVVQFGDGLRGKRPSGQSRVRAAYYRSGGGAQTNLPTGTVKQLVSGNSRLVVRHEWPMQGGRDAETVSQAEQRIPAHLNHRNRAVTQDDFARLAESNPVNPVSRAEVVPGLLPGSGLGSVREDIPGVISVFVLPPTQVAVAGAPRPTSGLLRDVYQYLDQRKLLGTELYVLSPQFIPVALSIAIKVLDPTTVTQTTQAVNQALLEYLWALAPGGPVRSGWPMGRNIDPNELKAVAARISGVLAVGILRLFHKNSEDGAWLEVTELSLQNYQLPEVMAVNTQATEGTPDAPSVVAPEAPDGPAPAAVPVIPEVC